MAKRTSDHIREHLLKDAFPKKNPPLEELRETEWSPEFETLMRNRLIMGAIRYGTLKDNKGTYDHGAEAERRLQMYLETGNLEYMVDVANFCLLEYLKPYHPKAHFASIDDGVHADKL